MSVKRKARVEDEGTNKRNRFLDNDFKPSGYEIKSRLDPVTGQRGAFPGLDDSKHDSELFYGPADDGLDYLRMVRAEALTIPSMLGVASNHHSTDEKDSNDGKTLMQRLRADEAIVAEPIDDWHDEWPDGGTDEEDQEPQDAYYYALLNRFQHLRSQLSQAPLKSVTADQADTAIKHITDSNMSYKHWYFGFTTRSPTPVHVARLSQSQVIVGLERLEPLLTKRNLERPSWRSNIGAWAWSLLAKCRDRTELNGEEIGTLRSLAKAAQRVGNNFRAIRKGTSQGMLMEDDNVSDGELFDEEEGALEGDADGQNAQTEDLEAARARLLGMFDTKATPGPVLDNNPLDEDSDPFEPILMSLDSIVTIVGELYGQRDLLDQRAAW